LISGHKDLFIPYKEKGKISIPFLMGDNGEEFCDWEKYLAEQGIEFFGTSSLFFTEISCRAGDRGTGVAAGQACSIDGKGC
jgi:hypothetical protein